MSILDHATTFLHSYAAAMHLAQDPTTTPSTCASALARHFLPGMTSFTFGNIHSFPTQADAVTGITGHLKNFEKAGWGYDVRLVGEKIEVLSGGSAVCWVKWKIFPKNEVESWEWENVYGYRRSGEGEGVKEGWEYSISDNEVKGIVERKPDFFS